MLQNAVSKLKNTPKKLYLIYILVYFPWGLAMNAFGNYTEIARFTYWWQVITCYIFYMVPISVLLKDKSFFQQYAYGLIAMGLLEFSGYALHTSYAFPNNILDQLFGIRNFALAMTLFFAFYFPLGNLVVGYLYKLFILKDRKT